MRPRFGWSELAGRRVGVWGVGVEGRASLRRLAALGCEPVVVDDAGAAGALVTGDGGLEALARCEVVVKSPGISRRRQEVLRLEAAGVDVVGGLGLWLAEAPRERVLCVTGTKGKSTTVSIAGHLAAAFGRRVVVGGNIGTPPYDPDLPDEVDLWVIEVSSYQATDVAYTPPVVALTSLHADHLDWHGGLEAYVADKLSLTTQEGARLTVGADDAGLRSRRDLLGPEVRWVGPDEAGGWAEGLGLLGRHNATNAAVAAAALAELGVPEARDHARLSEAAEGFTGLESRLRRVATVAGVDFFDDGLATNVLPTMAALDAFAGRAVAVILGGHDRGISYEPLAEHLARRTHPTLALTLPDSGGRIGDAVRSLAPGVEVRACSDLDEAVGAGFDWAAGADGVVLLSPAAPSFGRFRDYRERSAAFAAAARCASR